MKNDHAQTRIHLLPLGQQRENHNQDDDQSGQCINPSQDSRILFQQRAGLGEDQREMQQRWKEEEEQSRGYYSIPPKIGKIHEIALLYAGEVVQAKHKSERQTHQEKRERPAVLGVLPVNE